MFYKQGKKAEVDFCHEKSPSSHGFFTTNQIFALCCSACKFMLFITFWRREFPINHKPSKGENKHEKQKVEPLPVRHCCHLSVYDGIVIAASWRSATRIASFEERVS
jgi:hypothetical protein